MSDTACSQGDSEFHKGLGNGRTFDKMLTSVQRGDVVAFFRDSFLTRLDTKPLLTAPGTNADHFSWLRRFNSLGLVVPDISVIWQPWWSMTTKGRTMAALIYCSGFAYFEGEQEVFGVGVSGRGRFGPRLWVNDSLLLDRNWQESNVRFIEKTLSYGYLLTTVEKAIANLVNDPERELAQRLFDDLETNRNIAESRISELPGLLGGHGNIDGWSI